MPSTPFVRVVVLNYDGGDMTMRCLESLEATAWPADRLEIVLVDNASLDDVVERVRKDHPGVTLVESLDNLGFAGGCNLGIRAPGSFDHVALVNNDAYVEPDWLATLSPVLDRDPSIGAVSPKLVFAARYRGVKITAPTTRIGPQDDRLVGVKVTGVRVDGADAWDDVEWSEGFHHPEVPGPDEDGRRWSKATGEVRVADDRDRIPPRRLGLRLSALRPTPVTLDPGGAPRTVEVDVTPRWYEVDLPAEPHDVVNNAGSALYEGGFGGDRGFLERDEGQYDEGCEVFAWCGGAVLLRGEYLRDVGLFDERFFLYYEDTDLAWRGRLLGWRYWYEPAAVVRHEHAASSGEGSDLFRFYVGRNRLLMLTKDAEVRLAVGAIGHEVRHLVAAARHEVVAPLARARRPHPRETRLRSRVLGSYLKLAPAMVRDRRDLGRRRVVSDAGIAAWTVTK